MAGWQETAPGIWAYFGDDGTEEQPPPGEQPPGSGYGALAGSAAPSAPSGPGPAPAPGYVDPANAYIPAGLDSVQGSQSSSYTGTPKAAVDQFGKNIEAGTAQVESDVNAQANAAAQGIWDVSLKQQREKISDEDYFAAQSQYEVERQIAEENTRQQGRLAEMQGKLIQTELVAHAAAEKHLEMVGADYMGQVQQFAAMRVNPGQWWGNLSQGEQAGTLASVFVANFLGMRGRNTTVMNSINTAIDRNMDAQLQNIDNAGKVAGMYKTVYDMVVAQSATQEEARARMRGFYLAQLQQDIAVELSRYDAPLAQAKAAEARTALDMAFQKNLADLKAVWWDKGMTAKQLVVEQERAKLQAQQTSGSRATSQSYGRAAPVGSAGGGGSVEGDIAFNPRGDKPYGMFLAGTSPAVKADLRARSSATRTLSRKLVELTEFIDRNGGVWKPDLLSEQVNSDEAIRMKSLWTDLAAQYSIAMNGGARPSDFDVKNALKVVPIEGLTTRADVTKTLDDLVRQANATYDDIAATNVRQFRDDGEAQWASQYTGARPGVSDDYEATTRSGDPDATPGAKAQAQYKGKDSNTMVTVPAGSMAGERAKDAGLGLQGYWDKSGGDPTSVPDWFLALSDLVDSDPAEAATALDALDRELRVKSDDEPGVPERKAAVARLRQELGARPVSSPSDDRETVGGY